MKITNAARMLALGAIALLAGGVGRVASAITFEENTGWVITGPDTTGGNFIVNGTTSVGQLNSNTSPRTSEGGGDYVTLFAGGTASADFGATIEFDTPGNTLVIHGTVLAPNNDAPGSVFANTGVGYFSGTSINNQLLILTGNIYGGNGGAEQSFTITDTAVGFLAENGIYNIVINNSGGIFGGSIQDGTFPGQEFAIGDGVVLYDGGERLDINGVAITNSGMILGGSNNFNANVLDTAVALVSRGNVENFTITNTSTGVIRGGDGSSQGFVLGTGVAVVAGYQGDVSIVSSGTVNNAGQILGGDGVTHSAFDGGGNLSIAGSGVVFWGANGVHNVSITNSGLIAGGSGGDEVFGVEGFSDFNFGSVASTGVGIFDANRDLSDINGVTIVNSGTIRGGGGAGYSLIVGSGIGIVGLGDVSNITVANSGLIIGGDENEGADFGEGTGSAVVGAGVGIVAGAEFGSFAVNGVTINNTGGTIQGGNDNNEEEEDSGIIVGAGVGIAATNGVYNVNITNSGNILGGNDNGNGTISGVGIGIYDDNENKQEIKGVTINNSGLIQGGSENYFSFMAGQGIAIIGEGNVSDITINNSGSILGGNFNDFENDYIGEGIVISADDGDNLANVKITNSGTIKGGSEIGFDEIGDNALIRPDDIEEGRGENAIELFGGNVSNVTITNTGSIIGGTVENAERGGDGINIEGDNSDSNVTIENYGLITGGNGGVVEGGFGGDGGNGITVSSDEDPELNIINHFGGLIAGGNAGGPGGSGGDGINLDFGNSESVSILNFGLIQGGNSASDREAGQGIRSFADNLTITNWGVIAAGAGLPTEQAASHGYPGVAVSVQGDNNVINLNGHSAVFGTLEGSGNNNHLNLNFTGLSPAAIATLDAQIAQGVQTPEGFVGTFTVRGVTYYVDPLILGVNVTSYQLQGLTPNQAAVGASLDSIAVNPTGDLLNLYNTIDQSGHVPQALEALSPQPYQIYSDIAEATANFMTLSIDERMNNLRDGSESIDTTGIGGATDNTTTAGYDKDGKNVVVPDKAALQKRWGFFAQGGGLGAEVSAHGPDLQGANFTTGSLLVGVDGKVNDNLVLGLLFNYDSTTASLNAQGGSSNVQTLGGGVYAGYHNGSWYGNGLAAYGSNTYDSNRSIVFPGFNRVAAGSTDGDQEIINIDGGYDFHINDKLTVGPLAGLQYVHLNVDGFNEQGAGAADLAVGGQDVDSLRSRLGFRMDYHRQICKEVAFAAEVRAAWQHEFLDDGRAITGAFIGSGLAPFAVRTANPEKDAALVGVGINFTVRERATLYFDYDAQAGQASYLEQSIRGGLKLSF